jgi:hypothetical protein
MKLKLKGRRFGTTEDIHAESQRVIDSLTEKDFQEAFQKWRRRWDRCLHAGVTTSSVMAADRPYGEFYAYYRASPEYFGYYLVQYSNFNSCLHYCSDCTQPALFSNR